jgi:hypothetical protein
LGPIKASIIFNVAFRVSSLNYSFHQEINAIIDNIRKKEKKKDPAGDSTP